MNSTKFINVISTKKDSIELLCAWGETECLNWLDCIKEC